MLRTPRPGRIGQPSDEARRPEPRPEGPPQGDRAVEGAGTDRAMGACIPLRGRIP